MGHFDELKALEAELAGPDVADFLAFIRLKGLSTRTQVEYLRVLRLLCQSLSGEFDGHASVAPEDLRRFIARSQAEGLSPRTVANRAIILKRFFAFLQEEGHLASDPARHLPVPKLPGRLPKALTQEQVRRLFATLEETPLFRLRDKVLVTLMYTAGLRISEAVGLRREQLDLEHGTLQVTGKGSKERRIFLRPDAADLLRCYLDQLGDSAYVFPSPRGGHITQNHVQIEVGRYARKAGLPRGVTAHTLRHTCATHYLLGGAPITFVQGLLGHASLTTTGLYTGLVDEVAREIALRVPLAIDDPGGSEPPRRVREPGAEDWDHRSADDQVRLVLEWVGTDSRTDPPTNGAMA